MFGGHHKFVSIRLGIIFVLSVGMLGVGPVQANSIMKESKTQNGNIGEFDFSDPSLVHQVFTPTGEECDADSGWMWTNGASEPEVALQVEQELAQMGIQATVEARGYGETDNCGTYAQYGMDFNIILAEGDANSLSQQSIHPDEILPVLERYGKPNLGNVKLISPLGEVISIRTDGNNFDGMDENAPEISQLDSASVPGDVINKNVYVLVYDPILSNGQTLSAYRQWSDHAIITRDTVEFFKQATNNKMNFNIVETTVVNAWPELVDGFTYTETEYLNVLANLSPPHNPTEANYSKIVDDPVFDICGKANRGEIDEVWIYSGLWFGFYESRLVGPGAFRYNSPPVTSANTCTRLIPIMGPSYERRSEEAIHNFTHRTEATMEKVYGGWAQNRTNHNWDRFGLVKLQSPSYLYSGCGSSHYPLNAVSAAYDYGNSALVLSNCADFMNYPNLGDPFQVAQPLNCSVWGCNGMGYYEYWFNHMPALAGCGADNKSNDWWVYIAEPANALAPSNMCQSDIRWISGSTIAGVTLSYTDGIPKAIMTNASGFYMLAVSNNWSGTVTPSKLGYTFSPSSRTYTNVTSNQSSQNYTATVTSHTISGNTGVAGAILSYTDLGISKTVTANGEGSYSITIPHNWSGTITPAHPEYIFSPSNRSYSNVTASLTSQDYQADYVGFRIISGNTGIGGATVYYSDGIPKTATADASGNYSFAVMHNWSGVVIPWRDGYTFTPSSKTYANVLLDQSNQNYTAVVNACPSISAWRGEYWNNTSLSGNPFWCRDDANLDFLWGGANPLPGIAGNIFSARWSRIVRFTGGTYRFRMNHDDGARLFIDDVLKIDAWDSCCSWKEADVDLSPGYHLIRMEMYQAGGSSSAQLWWETQGINTTDIDVKGNNVSIVDGDTSPSPADHTDFGAVDAMNGSVSRVFTIHNVGDSTLTLSGSPRVIISGAHASDFSVTSQPAGEIWPAGSTTFTVLFDPGVVGVRTASLSISNNDANENPFNFSVQGKGVGYPSILSITRASPNPTSASSVNFNVTFSENVTGVDVSDFELAVTGLTDASLLTISGSGSNYMVSAGTGFGDGTLKLNLDDDNTIFNSDGYPLGGPGAGDGDFTAGETYTVSRACYTLNTNLSPDAGGVLNTTAQNCTGGFVSGTSVQLNAVPSSGWSFANWSGDLTGTTNPASITMDGNKMVTANFTQNKYTLTVDSVQGTVTRSPDQSTYHFGDIVQLEALPDFGWIFTGWSGDGTGSANPTNVTITGNMTVTAEYSNEPPMVASITRADVNPTSAVSVAFTVTFSESVTGVDVDDFVLTTTGVAGASITNVSGSGTSYTVTVHTGIGTGTIRLDVLDDNTIVDSAGKPLGGVNIGDGDFTSGEVYEIIMPHIFISSAEEDGWILESSETSGVGGTLNKNATLLRVGDDAANKQYRSILSFDTSTLPDGAVVTSVTLKFKHAGVSGTNPFNTHGKLLADICEGAFKANTALQLADFKAQCPAGFYKVKALLYTNSKVDNWYSQSLNPLDFHFINLEGVTQFRLRFTKDDNNDFGADFLKLFSGNALNEADRPQLVIEYYIQE